MIILWINLLLTTALAYLETITLIPIDSSSTLHVFNFSDSIQINSKIFKDFRFFPISIYQILQITQDFNLDLSWGTFTGIESYLLEYEELTGRKIILPQPGLSGRFQGQQWGKFKSILGGSLTVSFSKNSVPILHNSNSYFYENQFLCKENFEKVLDWLPCRDSGLVTLFDQLLHSASLSIHISGKRNSDVYYYTILITSSKKSKVSSLSSSCISTKQEVFENGLLDSVSELGLLKLSAKKPAAKPIFSQSRWLKDEEHGFKCTFFHELSNDSDSPIHLAWFEYFPISTTPLLSSITVKVSSIHLNSYGWVIFFNLTLPPGKVLLSIALDKKLQSFEDYPNDPQRGWDIIPSPVFISGQTFFSNGLLVMIPEPDFSMPFNVICITGSAIAFLFTSFQNIQTWKDSVHWSHSEYENSILKAKKRFGMLKNCILAVSLAVMIYLDQKGIIKMFG